MTARLAQFALDLLLPRVLPEGGLRHRLQGEYRPDATAWGILALEAWDGPADTVRRCRDRLAAEQQPDGRVSLAPDYPAAAWPTPLAVLAWQGSPGHREARQRAVDFLVRAKGETWPQRPDSPFGHNTALTGWPWILGTHSWVEPTALSLIALRVAGADSVGRVAEAAHLLLDRQLAGGGWNYGNTLVFGRRLFPMPETTGLALNALLGLASRDQIGASIEYLMKISVRLCTPRALAACLFGLGAWGERPPEAESWLRNTLSRLDLYGGFDTASLAMLLAAARVRGGMESLFAKAPSS